MGYRLEVSKLEYGACGGKLYGYISDDDLKELKSYQWLLNNEFIEGDEYWSYGCNPKIILDAEEFKEFITLYNEDWNEVYKDNKDIIINKEEIQELIKSTEYKILEWC